MESEAIAPWASRAHRVGIGFWNASNFTLGAMADIIGGEAMSRVQWSDKLLSGVEEIDNQHKELFTRISRLAEACKQGVGAQEISGTIEFLQEYTIYHFELEENYMAWFNYPEAEAHKRHHERFMGRVQELGKKLGEGGPTSVLTDTAETLARWLTEHIVDIDLPLIQFLRTQSSTLGLP